MYECLFTSMDVHICVAGAFEYQGKVLDSWDWTYWSHPVGAGNQTHTLCQSSQCSYLLNHFSSS